MEQKTYTISIYSENNVGLLSRVSAIFLKRHINIDSLNTSMSEIEDIFRFVIVAKLTEEQVIKIVKQIEKQIEVIKAFYHTDEETIFQESALYKVKSNSLFEQRQIQNVIKELPEYKDSLYSFKKWCNQITAKKGGATLYPRPEESF